MALAADKQGVGQAVKLAGNNQYVKFWSIEGSYTIPFVNVKIQAGSMVKSDVADFGATNVQIGQLTGRYYDDPQVGGKVVEVKFSTTPKTSSIFLTTISGFISPESLDVYSSAATSPTTTTPTTSTSTTGYAGISLPEYTVTGVNIAANFREKPDGTSKVITTIAKGKLIGKSDGKQVANGYVFFTRPDGKTGYIHNSLILKVTASSTPAATPTTPATPTPANPTTKPNTEAPTEATADSSVDWVRLTVGILLGVIGIVVLVLVFTGKKRTKKRAAKKSALLAALTPKMPVIKTNKPKKTVSNARKKRRIDMRL